jgi:hypothetical protein
MKLFGAMIGEKNDHVVVIVHYPTPTKKKNEP